MRIALIGYGEVGRIFAEELAPRSHALTAFDLKLLMGDGAAALREHARRTGVALVASHAAAVMGAELVVSAVTASQAVAVAEACRPGLESSLALSPASSLESSPASIAAPNAAPTPLPIPAPFPAPIPTPGAFFLDLNSASPGAKIRAAAIVNAAGGRYVEGAVMTSVPPYRLQVPLLLGGPDAAALAPVLNAIGFAATVASSQLGVASASKMCRSIMIKGLEAMVIESFTTARHYGVEDAVIASLAETFPAIDWEAQGAYFFQRVIEHGRRRSEEVREVAVTVREAGLVPLSAAGTAERQAWVAELADAGLFGERGAAGFARSADWRVEADRILKSLRKGTP